MVACTWHSCISHGLLLTSFRLHRDISVEHLVAWYKTDAGLPVGETTPLQKVIIAVTQLRQKKQSFGDRGSLQPAVQAFDVLTCTKLR